MTPYVPMELHNPKPSPPELELADWARILLASPLLVVLTLVLFAALVAAAVGAALEIARDKWRDRKKPKTNLCKPTSTIEPTEPARLA